MAVKEDVLTFMLSYFFFFQELRLLPLYCFVLAQNTVAEFSICVFCSLVRG